MEESKTKPLIYAAALIGAFLLLVAVIYGFGEAMHGTNPEQGLAKSVKTEILVQNLVKVEPGLRIDLHADAQAHRVPFSETGKMELTIRNLLDEDQSYFLDIRILPERAAAGVLIQESPDFESTLGPKEKRIITVLYNKNPEVLRTIDGTIDMVIQAKKERQ